MRILKVVSAEAEDALRSLERRRRDASTEALAVADAAIEGVRTQGDAFVSGEIARFDGVTIAPAEILIRPEPVTIDPHIARAIDVAIERIESFHTPQRGSGYVWQRGDTRIAHRVSALRRAGVYVPGGRAVYVSTLMMCAIPARIAGVEEIVVATTPAAAARPELAYTCARLGIREIYRAGGAAGVAALALGTATLRRVDKIAGPGNSYVTAAKARLVGEVGIDMTAGPTELVVIADETADPACAAADLLAQAEHGPDSAVILIATSVELARDIGRRAIPSLTFIGSIDDGVALVNRLAPEHLSIQARNAEAIAARVVNCGAIFLGRASAPAAGDYILGSNHVLPTAGSARFFSPLGVYDFVKRSNIVRAGEKDLEPLIELAATLAGIEGLPLHAASLAGRAAIRSAS